MNIGHVADTAQEDWSCNIFDVTVVTAGYGKNATGEGLNKGGGAVCTGLEIATSIRKSISSTPIGLQVNMANGSEKNR